MDSFLLDFNYFEKMISTNQTEKEIKREYRKLIKKYHPDGTDENKQKIYKEYTLRLIELYENYQNNNNNGSDIINKTAGSLDKKYSSIQSENHSFSKEQDDNNIYVKLLEAARKEYTAFKIEAVDKGWQENEVMKKHLENAVKCYKKIIKECKNADLVKTAKIQLQWVMPLYNMHNPKLVNAELNRIIKNRKKPADN